MLRSVLLPVLPLLVACSASLNAIVESRNLPPASAAPRILAITDLGRAEVPRSGLLRAESSDGVAAIGEAVWVQGADLGREPSVSIAGHQTVVLARTGDGGLVFRVPPGTPAGTQPLVVANEQGTGRWNITIRRRVLVVPPEGSSLAWAELGEGGPSATGSMLLPDAALLAVSPDGHAAYVTSGKQSTLAVIDLAARVPSQVETLDLGQGPAVVLAAAAQADVLAFVRSGDLVMIDIADPLHPVAGPARALNQAVRDGGIRDAALSPDGRLLAVIGAGSNVVHLLELGATSGATLVGAAAVNEGDAGLLREIAFSQDGRTVWVLAAEAHALSDWVPVQLHAAHIRGEPGSRFGIEFVHSVVAGAVADPVSMGFGKSGFVAGGAAWQPPEATTLYLSAGVRDEKRTALFRLAPEGMTEVASSDEKLGELAVSPDGRWLLSAARHRDGSLWLVSARCEERGANPAPLRLASSHSSESARGPARIRIQP